MERKASVNLHSQSPFTAYLTELLASIGLPLPHPCLSAAKLRKRTAGQLYRPHGVAQNCWEMKMEEEFSLTFTLSPANPEWISHIWMNSKVPDARPRAASHLKGQGRTVSGERGASADIGLSSSFCPHTPFSSSVSCPWCFRLENTEVGASSTAKSTHLL